MATNYIAPTWRMPENSNQSKVSNYSINFDGTSNFINCGNDSSLQITGAMTVSYWFKGQGGSASVGGVGKIANSPNRGFMLSMNNAGLTRFYIAPDATTTQFASTTITPDANWHHLVGVYNPSTSIALYLDNVKIAEVTAGVAASQYNGSNNLQIGARGDSTGFFDGEIDQVCIFDYALSTDQLTYLYNLNNPMAITGAEPIAYYPLGDNSNPTALAGYPNASVRGSVFDFDGGDDIITIANGSTIARQQNISYSLWVNTTDLTATQYIVGNSDSSNKGTSIFIVSGALVFQMGDNSNDSYFNSRVSSLSTYVNADEWFHVAASWDGTDSKIYINGIERNSWTPSQPYTIAGWSSNFIIGRRADAASSFFEGKLSNIAFWNSGLTAPQITTIYNNGSPGDISSLSPISWWKLNAQDTFDGTNWTIIDSSGSNNGTSAGMTSANLVQSDLYRETPYSNYSIKFDGTDYFADTGGGFFDSATSVSISCWMKMEDISAGRPVISNWGTSASDRQYLIRWADNTGNGFQFYFYGPNGATSGDFVLAESASTVTAVSDRWYNVVGTWDGSNIRIYVDGVERGSEASSGSVQSVTSANWIGRYSTTYMDGNLSNIALWKNTALTQAQITEIYNTGIPTDLSSFSGTAPTHWYTLDGKKVYYNGSVLVARDAIGTSDTTGVNLVQENIEGIAPGSSSNGTGVSLDITDLKGDMSGSTKNSHSINMADYGDPNGQGVTPADSGRTTSVPG